MSNDDLIYLLGKRVALTPHPSGFKPGLDTVMLAAACKAKPKQSILDLGCGIGSAGLCVLARVPSCTLYGIDVQDDHVAIAAGNAKLNSEEARFECRDVKGVEAEERFDHVICNPPYLKAGAHLISPDDAKAKAMGHLDEEYNVDIWVKAAHRNVKSGGTVTIIHRADQVDEIIRSMGKKFGAVEIIPLWPKSGVDAKRVIVRAIKDRKTPARMSAGIIIHNDGGQYTQRTEDILREACAID